MKGYFKSPRIFVFMLVLLASCGESNQSEVSDSSTVETDELSTSLESAFVNPDETETVLFALEDTIAPQYEELIDIFESENPHINIKVVSINALFGWDELGGDWPSDANELLASSADVINIGGSQKAIQQGLLLNLTPFIEATPRFQTDDFYPSLLEQYQSNGSTWAIPMQVYFELFFYNKDLFDASNLQYPQPGWTWNDFLRISLELTQYDEEQIAQWGFVEFSPSLIPLIEDKAGTLFDVNSEPPLVRLNDQAVVDAITWYTDLYLVHQVAPYYPLDTNENLHTIPNAFQLVENNKVAMWLASSSNWEYFSERQQMNIGAAPYPVNGPNSKTSPVSSSSFSISSGSQNPQAAWEWINFLSRQTGDDENNYAFYGRGGLTNLPARRSIAESSGYWETIDGSLAEALQFAVNHGYTQNFAGGADLAYYQAIHEILSGKFSVAEAVTNAQTQAEKHLIEAVSTQNSATLSDSVIVVDTQEGLSSDAKEITFSIGGGVYNLQSYRDLAEQFQQIHPNTQINIKQLNLGNNNIILADARADCFQFASLSNFPEPEKMVISLEPFFNNDLEITEEYFFPTALDAFTHQGDIWGIPADIDIGTIEYNKNLFDAAGLEYPPFNWTIEDFTTLAIDLTTNESETIQYGFVPSYLESVTFLNFIDKAGARLIDDNLIPPAVTFTHPDTVSAVYWYVSLTQEHGVKPTFITNLTKASTTNPAWRQSLIDNNQAAMWSSSSFEANLTFNTSLRETEQGELRTGTLPLPTGMAEQISGGYQAINGYYISAGAQEKEACWEWLKFLSTQPSIISGFPARISVAESNVYYQQVGQERIEAYLSAMQQPNSNAYYRFNTERIEFGSPFIWLAQAYDQILTNNVSVEEALVRAQYLADIYRECILKNEVRPNRIDQQACLEETSSK